MKKFDGLSVSSKFAICGMPIRVDSYKTCSFGCKYCFANGRKIMEFKKHLQIADLEKIHRKMKSVFVDGKNEDLLGFFMSKRITWHCGGMSDPFQPVEGELGITRDLVDLCNQFDQSILFSTKSDNVYDANLNPDLHSFQLSVSNMQDRKDIEPNVPSIEKRVELFRYLKRNGFKVGIRIQPFIPNISGIDIIKTFKDADHFTIEGIKIVPQNQEQKDFVYNQLGLDRNVFTQKGLLNIKPQMRLKMYQPLIEYMDANGISYSISDNDLRRLSNNCCCCGDALCKNATTFNTTAMIKKYGDNYKKEDIDRELSEYGCCDKKCYGLFTSNRTQGCKTVQEFYDKRFFQKTSPFSPLFQYQEEKTLFD